MLRTHAQVDALLSPRRADDRAVMRRVSRIVDAVRAEGDAAVRRFAAQFDGFDGPFEIPRAAWKAEARKAPRDVRAALKVAAANIARVAQAQRPLSRRVRVAPGITVEQRVRPLDRVGCYVPGGRYPLPSTLLMTAIPARVAGVPESSRSVRGPTPSCSRRPRPRASRGCSASAAPTPLPLSLSARRRSRAWIASSARATSTSPPRRTMSRSEVGIDMQAGPSEILILSDSGDPAWLAADLIAQAEHDPDARALLITTKRRLAAAVAREVDRRVPDEGPARASLAANGGIIVARTRAEMIALANRMAPEHLVVTTRRQPRP